MLARKNGNENPIWSWNDSTTCTIEHTCLDVIPMKDVHDITRGVFNRHQSLKSLKRNNICLTDSDHDYIIDEIVGG